MKKLLLTIFTIAAIVACDKDAVDQEITNINVLEQAEEINASVENGISAETGDMLIDYLIANQNNLLTTKVKGTASNTSKGSDYVNVVVYSSGGFTYLALLDEDNDDVCFNNIATTQFFWDNSAGDGSVLTIEDADENVVREIRGNFAQFFGLALNSISQLTLTSTDLTINGSENLGALNTATVEGADVNFICAEGKYTITPAPFPLSGFLATIIDESTFTGTSANYAGTDRDAVISAVEANIVDGN